MIDNWFKKDVDKILKNHSIAVFVDESKEAFFLLDNLKEAVSIYGVANEIEELKAKYEIEKSRTNGEKFLIYTTTAKSDLKFVREYCETNGCVEIKYFDHYIKKKVNQHLNLNINIPKEELISAAKVSVGKDQTYWMDLSHKGASEIFDLEKELLPFLHDPKSFVNRFDTPTQKIFFKKVTELIGQTYIEKPAITLASEVVNCLLDGLWNNNINPLLLNVYKTWLDSLSYRASFDNYLEKYKTGKKANPFDIHPSHPFLQIDELCFREIGTQLQNGSFITSVLPKVNQRNENKAARSLGITFWKEVKVLLEFDEKNINQISSFKEAVDFYIKHFSKLDSAIRKLYSVFLTQKEIIEPWQAYYKNLATLYLDKWFRYIDDYKSNQTGKIQEILDQHSDKTAIIVGDGVSWEFAQDIIEAFGKSNYELTKKYLFAGLPSETEHNMSQLYVNSGVILGSKKEREDYLSKHNTDKDIQFIDLENVNETTDKAIYLICSYKDPDKLGETYQQKALKYFDQVAATYASKIKQLLQNGYKQVYLVTDHGFTLSGILESSDKIEIAFSGEIDKSERYIRTKTKQQVDNNLLIEKELPYKNFQYCYFAKRLGPFKTPGVYGFSHGGISPQETLIPYFKWTNVNTVMDRLEVVISNKSELKEVTGNLFSIKLKGVSESSSLFAVERKVILMFFAGGKEINRSDIITIEKGKEIKKEYQFDSHQQIEIKVLDVETKEQLDKTSVLKSSARDLGGLL
ncbi:hypothetical protein [Mangrovimonas sp. DI 80]|uniref:hypothetical protein n=1 Tax=Mangrovimonas sp. DI 80 TaxID=1779330 RepID=UPI000978999D|nr:hypothetical protein [Mangrovimonas sp. DI 80]OMP32276.1 hypothetical protein BKM32_04285 [Mangrovimonas sp. DI 80]